MFDALTCQLCQILQAVCPPDIFFVFTFQAILHFVNQNMSTMGLQVADMDKQVKKKTQQQQQRQKNTPESVAASSQITSPPVLCPLFSLLMV